MPETDQLPPGEPCDGRFELGIRGTTVELTVYPPSGGARAVNAGEISAALAEFPLDRYLTDRVFAAVKAPSSVPIAVGVIEFPASHSGAWGVKVSPNKMAAYVVPIPPREDSDTQTEDPAIAPTVSEEDLRARLAELKINCGLLHETLVSFTPPRTLESVVKVAEGVPATSGKNATLQYMFDANPHITPVELEDGSVDYHAAVVNRFVEASAVLVRRVPPEAGEPGRDIFGTAIPPRPVVDKSLNSLRGKETRIEGDNLVAVIAGRPITHGDKVEVLPIYEVRGDLDFSVGNIDFVGDVLIAGDVKPGFVIRAGGSVTVRGIVDRATIVAGKDITVRGMSGEGNHYLEAGHEVIAHYIHNAVVTAGVMVKAHREIVNCTVRAPRVETASTARIVGGCIEAVAEVDAGTIGSPRGVPTEVTVERGTEGKPAVVRARRSIHPRVMLKVHHAVWCVDDDYPASSFWEFAGEVSRLGPAAKGPDLDQAA